MKNEPYYDSPGPYLGFFEEFNQGRFFEAHEVLEVLWLEVRGTPPADYYKGLIQLAGAFVHLRHDRPGPAAALFRLARNNLLHYQPFYLGLAFGPVLDLIQDWLVLLESPPLSSSFLALRPLPHLPLPVASSDVSLHWTEFQPIERQITR